MGFSKILPNVHLNKDWQEKVKTFFNQPAKKVKRRQQRKLKQKRLGFNPTNKFRPAVRGQTRRYNNKLKLGRGFTLNEIKLSGLKGLNYVKSLGIAVDSRRKDTCAETQKLNVQRLKEYTSRMILHPRRHGQKEKYEKKPQVLEATADQLKTSEAVQQNTSKWIVPLPKSESAFTWSTVTDNMKKDIVYKTLRKELKTEKGFYKRLENAKKKAQTKK